MSNLSYSAVAYLHAVPGLEFDATATSVRLLLEALHARCRPHHCFLVPEVWWSRPWIRSPCSRPTPLALKKRAFRRAATRAACE